MRAMGCGLRRPKGVKMNTAKAASGVYRGDAGTASFRALIQDMLLRAETLEWSLQGMGMFRHYLSRDVRLHVWDMRFMAAEVSTIHTHPWDFTSEVLSGLVVDRLYAREDGVFYTHHEQRIVCGPGGGCTADPPKPTRLGLPVEHPYPAGEVYVRRAEEIHETVARPGTVTVIHRRFKEDTEHASVFYRLDRTWVSAEPRRATLDEVRSMAKLALDRWEGT
jgi:hypothetical protein